MVRLMLLCSWWSMLFGDQDSIFALVKRCYSYKCLQNELQVAVEMLKLKVIFVRIWWNIIINFDPKPKGYKSHGYLDTYATCGHLALVLSRYWSWCKPMLINYMLLSNFFVVRIISFTIHLFFNNADNKFNCFTMLNTVWLS